jgi:hypothetical protein
MFEKTTFPVDNIYIYIYIIFLTFLCTQARKEICCKQHAPGTAGRSQKSIASYSIL